MKTTKLLLLFMCFAVMASLIGCGNGGKRDGNSVAQSFDFEDGKLEPWYASDCTAEIISKDDEPYNVHDGKYSVKLSNRKLRMNGLYWDVKDIAEQGSYAVSFWAKLAEGENPMTVSLTCNIGDSDDVWSWPTLAQGEIVSYEWREIKGEGTVSWLADLQNFEMQIARPYQEGGDESTQAFYVDDIKITSTSDREPQKDIQALKDVFKDDFNVGVVTSAGVLSEDAVKNLIKKHYNVIGVDNAGKMDWVMEGITGEGAKYSTAEMTFKELDVVAEFAKKNKMKMRLHGYLYPHLTPDAFFEDDNGNEVSADVLKERIRDYIFKYTEHMEKNYPGLVYSWDVLNEIAVDTTESGWRDGTDSGAVDRFYTIIGEDYPVYVFQCAQDAYDEIVGTKREHPLFCLNDYGQDQQAKKRDLFYDRVKTLLDKGAPITSVAIQAHSSLDTPKADTLDSAIKLYASLGLKVEIAELDMQCYDLADNTTAYNNGIAREAEIRQAYQYKMMVDVIRDNKDSIAGLTFWNVSDDISWLDTPYRKAYPTLFDSALQAKEAYYAITGTREIPVLVKNGKAMMETCVPDGQVEGTWAQIASNKLSDESKGSFKAFWDLRDLSLLCYIDDKTATAIDIYIDPQGESTIELSDKLKKITINMDGTVAGDTEGVQAAVVPTEKGFLVEALLPIGAMKNYDESILFDLIVNTPEEKIAWSDTSLQQETTMVHCNLLKAPS